MSDRKIVGWCMLIPRLLVMTSASISLYHAYSIGSMLGITAGIILTGIWVFDAAYLTIVIIHDLIKKDNSWSEELREEISVAVDEEQKLFDTHEKE